MQEIHSQCFGHSAGILNPPECRAVTNHIRRGGSPRSAVPTNHGSVCCFGPHHRRCQDYFDMQSLGTVPASSNSRFVLCPGTATNPLVGSHGVALKPLVTLSPASCVLLSHGPFIRWHYLSARMSDSSSMVLGATETSFRGIRPVDVHDGDTRTGKMMSRKHPCHPVTLSLVRLTMLGPAEKARWRRSGSYQ